MKKTVIVAVTVVAALFAGAAGAQNLDAIKARQALMKEVGGAAKPLGDMLKGAAFDLAAVQKSLATFAANSEKLKSLYPDDSKTGNDTAALPSVWEKKAEFVGLYKKFADESAAAAKVVTDEASFKANVPPLFKNCVGCHDNFRLKK